MNIYTAHPISGESFEDVVSYYENLRDMLGQVGYKVLCPMTGKGYLRTELKFKAHGYKDKPISTNHAIIERDRWMIEQSDIVLADLRKAERVSIGCMFELAWAMDNGKHTIVIMEEDNIHRHAFVIEAADIIFQDLGDALKYLTDLNAGELRLATPGEA